MTLKELSAVAEVVQGLYHTDEIIDVGCCKSVAQNPTIFLREAEYVKHFGNTLLQPFDEKYDKRAAVWNGVEVFCLVSKA